MGYVYKEYDIIEAVENICQKKYMEDLGFAGVFYPGELLLACNSFRASWDEEITDFLLARTSKEFTYETYVKEVDQFCGKGEID